jgi:hypothetical protein
MLDDIKKMKILIIVIFVFYSKQKTNLLFIPEEIPENILMFLIDR